MYDEKELFNKLCTLYNSGIKNVDLMMKPSSVIAKQYGDKVPLGYPDTMGEYADKFLGKVIKCKIEIDSDRLYGIYFRVMSNSLSSWAWSHYSFYLPEEQLPIVTKLKSL